MVVAENQRSATTTAAYRAGFDVTAAAATRPSASGAISSVESKLSFQTKAREEAGVAAATDCIGTPTGSAICPLSPLVQG
jgi:hypothetical protein